MAKIEMGIVDFKCKLEKFKTIVLGLKGMIDDCKTNIIFGIEEDIRFEIDDSYLENYSLNKEELDKVINIEIIPIMESLLNHQEESFVNVQVRKISKGNKKDGEKELELYKQELIEKVNYIKEILIDDILMKRYIIKKTTKHSKIKSISWEINKKIFDASSKELINAKYATVKLQMVNGSDDDNPLLKIFPFMQQENGNNSLTFDCDENDIEYLIKIFSNIKVKLNKYE
jgi:hypothetical protein